MTAMKDPKGRRPISESLQASIFHAIPIGVFFAINRVLVHVNQALCELLGYAEPEILEHGTRMFYDSDEEYERVGRELYSRLAGSERTSVESHLVRKDGTILFAILTAAYLKADDPAAGHIVTIQDITKRRLAEEALHESENRVRGILEQAPFSIQVFSPEGDIIFTNTAFEKLWAVTQEDLKGYNILRDRQIEALGIMPAVHRAFDGMPSTTPTIEYNAESTVGKGNLLVVQGILYPVLDVNDAILYVIMIHLDFTKQARIEKERKKLEERLQQAQKMEAIGTLAGGIAHDFNNILSSIMGYSELCLHEVRSNPKASRHAEQILKAADRARDLVQQILTFSRKAEPEKNPLSLAPIIKEVVKFMRASLPTTIEIRQKTPETPHVIMADPSQMYQVLMNLCTNASHAMKESGGILEIGLRQVEIEAGAALFRIPLPDGRYVELSVRDTGQGIPQQNLGKIFDPYFTTKQQGEGTGLGLSVVLGIVKDHHGEIRVYSEEGKGSHFMIYLPLVDREIEVGEHGKNTIIPPGKGETVLFIDDEQMIVDMSSEILEDLGYRVLTETDPVKAIDLLKSDIRGIDIVITDKTMPHMTGFEVVKAIKTMSREIPVILCSGFLEKSDLEKITELNVDRVIVKPIQMSALANAVRELLDGTKM
ncbi:MAG TPA: ATP-binding protein [Syntrophales bacterium]|nr:ATP-binding protein [Syntrophales bacterium]